MGVCEFGAGGVTAVLVALIIGASACPTDPNCVCGGTLAYELNCNIDGHTVKINYLPKTYLSIECDKTYSIDYSRLPQLSANKSGTFTSVSFKQCPLPDTSFRDVLSKVGVAKTMSLIYQNSRNLSNSLNKKLFTGLQDLSKLSLSINGVTYLPDDLFVDVYNLTWLNIRSNTIGFSERLFKPLDKLETLEISHNHKANISGNIFSHLSYLRRLSLWQSNVTNFSEDLFAGVNVLEELDLSSNGLNELPSSLLSPLRKLKKLTLFSNKFSSLPSNLLENNQELDTIIIFNNDVKLMQLPRMFLGNLPKLQQSYIQRCSLETIPFDVFMNSSQLTNISLAYNELNTLPEAVFNDQINLLDLDLSNNRIKSLPSKLFSSLVRLETLKLSYNELEEISSATFSSLLSLTHFDVEHNKLKTISSFIFSNNKQRIWINMAHNQLNFVAKDSNNSSHKQKSHLSPFAYAYQLKLLNLSYNAIDKTFSDWWYNAYENLDLSFNKIKQLTVIRHKLISKHDKKLHHLKFKRNLWISNNPIECDCKNLMFLTEIQKRNIQVMDNAMNSCPDSIKITCDTALSSVLGISMVLAIAFFVITSMFVFNFLFRHKSDLYIVIKKWCNKYFKQTEDERYPLDVVVIYAEIDKDFVKQEIISKLENCKQLRMKTFIMHSNTGTSSSQDLILYNNVYSKDTNIMLVVTPNYIDLIKNKFHLKRLHENCLKNDNVLFILTSEVSSYNTFNKDSLKTKKTLQWDSPDRWNKLMYFLQSHNLRTSKKTNIDLIAKCEDTVSENDISNSLSTRHFTKFSQHNGPIQNLA